MPKSVRKARLVVLGGMVSDLMFQVDVEQLPRFGHEGSTIQASDFELIPGGKGLNQALAASGMAADVTMLGIVGNDDRGRQLVEALKAKGVVTEAVKTLEDVRTPVAAVFVQPTGETAFVGWKNLNAARVTIDHVRSAADRIQDADALLMTLEVNLDALHEAVGIAREADVNVLLNPAPKPEAADLTSVISLLQQVDVIVPNYWEAATLLRQTGPRLDVLELARELSARSGGSLVCVTDGPLGCAVASPEEAYRVSGIPSVAADTTGGSDAFCAALAVALCSGKLRREAVDFANAAGAWAVRRRGGSTSMPSAEGEVTRLQKESSVR